MAQPPRAPPPSHRVAGLRGLPELAAGRHAIAAPDVQQLLGHRDPRTTAGYDCGRRGLTRQAAALSHLAATLLPDPPPDDRDLVDEGLAVDIVDEDQAVNERGAEWPIAVAAPAVPSGGGRSVDLPDQLGELAGSWQVAETAPGSGSWAVLRDGVRVGLLRRESTTRGRRGWLGPSGHRRPAARLRRPGHRQRQQSVAHPRPRGCRHRAPRDLDEAPCGQPQVCFDIDLIAVACREAEHREDEQDGPAERTRSGTLDEAPSNGHGCSTAPGSAEV